MSASEIVVTAQRRAERAQDVPIAMSVVGGDQIERQRVNNLNDLTRVAASLQLAPQPGGSGGGGYIRGIGTYSRSRAAEPSVGIVVDGVVQGLTNIRNLSDIARVEVLRGPQGTLFGQSVSAGVINITTVAPDPSKISGKVSVELSDDGTAGSEFGRQIGRASLNVPLASNIAVRVTGYGSRTEGVLENAYTGGQDLQKEAGVRGRLLGEFGAVTVNLVAEYNYDRTTGGGFPVIWRVLPTATNKSAALFAACGVTPGIANHSNCGDGNSDQKFIVKGYSGQIDYDAGPLALTSITAFRQLDSKTQNDIDNLPAALSTTEQQSGLVTNYKQFTQEFRAATDANRPLSLTMGAFYLHSSVDSHTGPSVGVISRDYVARAGLPIAACFPVATVAACNSFTAPPARNIEQEQDFGITNGSIFGELRYHQGGFTAFAGGRLISSKVTLDGYNGATPQNLRDSDTAIAWRAGTQYAFNRDLMLYATVARGYKGAQIAPINGTAPAAVINPEIPTSYEAGIKTSLFNRRVNFNISGFYSRVKDYQTSSCTIVNNLVSCVPINISKVVSKGIEADLFGRIDSHWTVNANAVYNIVKYPAGFLADDGTNLGGQQLSHAPKFVATFSTDYAVPLKGEMEAFLSFDVSYKSRERLGTLGASDLYIYKANAVLGGRVGVRVDKSWSVALFANNITGQNQPQEFSQLVNQYPDPRGTVYGVFQTARSLRLVGIQAQYQF